MNKASIKKKLYEVTLIAGDFREDCKVFIPARDEIELAQIATTLHRKRVVDFRQVQGVETVGNFKDATLV